MSSAVFAPAGHPVTAAIDDVAAAVDVTVGADVSALSDDDLAEVWCGWRRWRRGRPNWGCG
jgi:hypothetical protein